MKNPAVAFVALCSLLFLHTQTPHAEASEDLKIRQRHMLGAYKKVDAKDERLMAAANFALTSFLAGEPSRVYSFSTLLGASEGSDSDGVFVKIIEAHQQVVAGMNYRLTLGMFQGEDCLGAFKVTVYDRFGDLSVTDWGDEVSCGDVEDVEGTARI